MENVKNYFGEELEQQNSLDYLVKILKLTPAQRNSRHLVILEKVFKDIRFFRERVEVFGRALMENVCEKVSYEFFKAGSVRGM
jgi:hypothetical protein